MKFTKVVGKIDKNLVAKAEEVLGKVFLKLGAKYDNPATDPIIGGGDPLIFALVYPAEHICTMSIDTAATDGKRFYWNPKFLLKHTQTGLRFLCTHESGHAIYMHPARRGSRNPRLWNIAVDYIVNGMIFDDCKARGKNGEDLFSKHLGRFMTLSNYIKFIKDPFSPPPGFEDLDLSKVGKAAPTISRNPMKELTEQQMKDLDKEDKTPPFFFGDPGLEDDMKSPEKIYNLLYQEMPKCPDCGTLGMVKLPPKGNKKDKSNGGKKEKGDGDKSDQQGKGDGKQDQKDGQDQGDQDGQGQGDQNGQQGQGQSPGQGGCCGSGCPTCGSGGDGDGEGYADIFGLGGQLDDHIDTEETQEKLAKRIAEAMETAKRMAGSVPAAFEDELGQLTAPKIKWQDVIRGTIRRVKEGKDRSDWNRFKTRPMFSGLLVPKRKCYTASFGCLFDTSGSMSQDDIAYGLSQLQSLDEGNEGFATPADCSIYWQDTVKIRKASKEELQKVKVTGRGGTMLHEYFQQYEENIGKQDFIIMITDGFLSGHEMEHMQDPGIPVFWIITSGADFKPKFGKVYNLHNE